MGRGSTVLVGSAGLNGAPAPSAPPHLVLRRRSVNASWSVRLVADIWPFLFRIPGPPEAGQPVRQLARILWSVVWYSDLVALQIGTD